MTYDELREHLEAYLKSEKEYRNEAEKHFPTNLELVSLPVKATFITKEEILKIKDLREIRDKKEEEWHKAMVIYCKSRK